MANTATFEYCWTVEQCIQKMDASVGTRQFREHVCEPLYRILDMFDYKETHNEVREFLMSKDIELTFKNLTWATIQNAQSILCDINKYMMKFHHGTNEFTWFLRFWDPFVRLIPTVQEHDRIK